VYREELPSRLILTTLTLALYFFLYICEYCPVIWDSLSHQLKLM
jgi:hypothetical protein